MGFAVYFAGGFGVDCGFWRFVTAHAASPRRVPEPAAAHASLRAKIAASGSGTRHGYECLLTMILMKPITSEFGKALASQCWLANKAQVRGGVGVEAILARSDA